MEEEAGNFAQWLKITRAPTSHPFTQPHNTGPTKNKPQTHFRMQASATRQPPRDRRSGRRMSATFSSSFLDGMYGDRLFIVRQGGQGL